MSNEELLEENKKLKERIQYLENILNRGNTGNSSAYNAIRGMIINKVAKEVDVSQYEGWQRKHKREVIERQIMRDLKWDLHVRNISDFRAEHVKQAEEYINSYIIPEELKK